MLLTVSLYDALSPFRAWFPLIQARRLALLYKLRASRIFLDKIDGLDTLTSELKSSKELYAAERNVCRSTSDGTTVLEVPRRLIDYVSGRSP